MYATQQIQKAEGLARRKAQRGEMKEFVKEFRAKEGRSPSIEEIAAHFHRSRSWVANLRQREAEDRKAEIAMRLQKSTDRGVAA
jgi:3-methyladenine DNA glycosylase Tag